jgi:hypothetical protein
VSGDGTLVRRSAEYRGGRALTSGPALSTVPIFNYSNDFQMVSNLNWSKNDLLMLKNFQIKYGHVENEQRTNHLIGVFRTLKQNLN